MFDDFARQWTPLLPSSDITSAPRGLCVAGENVVTWRDTSGRPAVLLDRCPHRGVALSLGSSTADGALACPFHGWEFRGDGACTHVPFNPGIQGGRRSATALPVVEEAGFVWVFTGFDVTDADPRPNYADTLARDAGVVRWDHWEEWDCHWTRAMENMLDFPHLPYVHRTTIGRFVRAKMTRHSGLRMSVDVDERGFVTESAVDDNDAAAALRWFRPHAMTLDPPMGGKLLRLHVFCVPIDESHTRMILSTVRDFARDPMSSATFNAVNAWVLHQDRAIVESSDPVVAPARGEVSVPTDKATLTFRTWYHRHLVGTSVPDPRPAASVSPGRSRSRRGVHRLG